MVALGDQSALATGITMMLRLPVDNWDTLT